MDEDTVDTGLVAAAVTIGEAPTPHIEPPAPPELVAAAVALALPKVQMPSGWDLHKVAAFVTDMAQNMYDLPVILAKHNLTAEQYDVLKDNEFFKRALEAEIITWNSAASIQKRIQLESAIAIEAFMPTVAARLGKSTEPLSDVVALLKVLSEIAGTSGAKAAVNQPGAGEKFKIIINLGADVTEKEVNLPSAVQSIPEGPGALSPLQALVQTN